MSDCCSTKEQRGETSAFCPQCRTPLKAVSVKTLRHHLRFPDNLDIDDECDYAYYCPAINCKVTYLSENIQINKQQCIAGL